MGDGWSESGLGATHLNLYGLCDGDGEGLCDGLCDGLGDGLVVIALLATGLLDVPITGVFTALGPWLAK